MHTPLAIGDTAPAFTLAGDGDQDISLADFKGQNLVLYFYPKDDTSGCTTEAIDFTSNLSQFSKLHTSIVGVSKDSVKKHDKFKAKHALKIRLASDEELSMIQSYGVWVEKNMYGRKYMGIERSTFLIDKTGKIAHIWRKVRVKDHAKAVLDTLNQMSS
ncbi:Thiol peroxidase, Bcp-type [hydrothermal vent metagenome]|uniref:thioredoxin-dependent peroxiredoxin n=1 Tax=hydrothermal vent metagenome TaxID=652676 RepID=A0A3B0SE57_9ZZZZ